MLRRVLLGLGAVLALLLVIPVSNLFRDQPYHHTIGQPILAPRTAVLASLDEHCMDCHDRAAQRPFYAGLPAAERRIESDVAHALDAFDLDVAFRGGPPDAAPEVVLARLEHVLLHRAMPPARYVALHWQAALTRAERQELLRWIATTRARYYAPPATPVALQSQVVFPLRRPVDLDVAKVAVGRMLFHDSRLSGDGRSSCASCHDLDQAGIDRRVVSLMPDGQPSGVNTPTVLNAAFQVRQGWHGAATSLREQTERAVRNPIEMAAQWDVVLPRLARDKVLAASLRAIYRDGLTRDAVVDALAAFQGSLVTPDAPFDRWLLGDAKALDAAAQRGYGTFLETGCANCHVGKVLGGQSLEPLDLGGADPDHAARAGSVKVPMLRNVAATAPYMHDGSVPSLRQAVSVMAATRTRAPLTDAARDDVVAFLHALNGRYDGQALR